MEFSSQIFDKKVFVTVFWTHVHYGLVCRPTLFFLYEVCTKGKYFFKRGFFSVDNVVKHKLNYAF